ncbi:glycosyltransferase family 2 protein [Roseibium sp.]|uniref:glycosyltransferase family 2 protein n=1 Tax=Roseibium sp. TaxID=1936156 RepID=UPI003A977749
MTTSPSRIGIMVCTAGRPQMLVRCLRSLIAQPIQTGWSVEICVVENDTEPRSLPAIEALQVETQIPIHHVLEPKRGIPFARNRSLREAKHHGFDWIALIDDDEVADEAWLGSHMASVTRHSADVSYGAVTKDYEAPQPDWWPRDTGSSDPDGTVLSRASTNNVLFSRELISGSAPLRFDEDLRHGYEDLDFFERASGRGHKIVWTPAASVEETVSANRVRPERLIQMVHSQAAAHAQVACKRSGFARACLKFGLKGLRRIVGGSLLSGFHWLAWKVGNENAQGRYFRARLRLARGAGNWYGLTRGQKGFYDQLDGH